jgi:hypothetical protein
VRASDDAYFLSHEDGVSVRRPQGRRGIWAGPPFTVKSLEIIIRDGRCFWNRFPAIVSSERNEMANTPKPTIPGYHRPKHRDRQVLGIADFKETDIEAIENNVAPPEAAMFDHEIS